MRGLHLRRNTLRYRALRLYERTGALIKTVGSNRSEHRHPGSTQASSFRTNTDGRIERAPPSQRAVLSSMN
jgi:hypothetical protein